MSLARDLLVGAVAAALGAAAGAIGARAAEAFVEKAKELHERRRPKIIRP